jgi:hypothetical protein
MAIKLYAGTILAINRSTADVSIQCQPHYILAESREAATGILYDKAKIQYPGEKGWTISVSTMPIPDKIIQQVHGHRLST